ALPGPAAVATGAPDSHSRPALQPLGRLHRTARLLGASGSKRVAELFAAVSGNVLPRATGPRGSGTGDGTGSSLARARVGRRGLGRVGRSGGLTGLAVVPRTAANRALPRVWVCPCPC